LNNDNPFISKPNQAEIYSFKGKITLQECVGLTGMRRCFEKYEMTRYAKYQTIIVLLSLKILLEVHTENWTLCKIQD
jgi:hypothetical protein